MCFSVFHDQFSQMPFVDGICTADPQIVIVFLCGGEFCDGCVRKFYYFFCIVQKPFTLRSQCYAAVGAVEKRKAQFRHIMKVYRHWDVRDPEIVSVIYGYYAARLVQCVQEIAISSGDDREEQIREILEDRLTRRAFRLGKIDSRMLRAAALPMRYGSVKGSILMGKSIGYVKTNYASVFYKLKSLAVNKAVSS